MARKTSNITISSGSCGYYSGRWTGGCLPRSCYDCVTFEISSMSGVGARSCMVDASGTCVARATDNSSAITIAQLNRTYCEPNDAACGACLASKPSDFAGLSYGADGCFYHSCRKRRKVAAQGKRTIEPLTGRVETSLSESAKLTPTRLWPVLLALQGDSDYEFEIASAHSVYEDVDAFNTHSPCLNQVRRCPNEDIPYAQLVTVLAKAAPREVDPSYAPSAPPYTS